MEWFPVNLSTLRHSDYVSQNPVCRATWLNLSGYCAQVENGGRIADCADWPDRMWQQLAGVTQREVADSCSLFEWEGNDLVVRHYPRDAERKVRVKRENGARGGRPPKVPDNEREKPDGYPNDNRPRNRQDKTEEREERDKKEQTERAGAREGSAKLLWGEVVAWVDDQNGTIPDRPRAKSLARELFDEMERKKWLIQGQPVKSRMGLLVSRLKRDKAYFPNA